MKKIIKRFAFAIVLLEILLLLDGSASKAFEIDDSIQSSEIYFSIEDTTLKEKPQNNSKKIADIASGEMVILIEKTDDYWLKVQYSDEEGYVLASAFSDNSDSFTQEVKEEALENEMRLRDAEYAIKKYKQTRFWGTVILVLVIAIFGTGIINAVRGKKEENTK